MLYRLLGYRTISFTPDGGGNPISGTQCFVSAPDNGVVGEAADKFFVRADMELPTLTVGMMLDVEFNRKGRLVAIKAAAKN